MIIFRVDAAAQMGFGHLTRCVYLASQLRSLSPILFLVRPEPAVTKFLAQKDVDFRTMKEVDALPWASVRSVIFDLRKFDAADLELLQRARQSGMRTVQITDLGLEQQDVDFTVDASLHKLHAYAASKAVCSGPDYVILHHRFRHFHQVRRKYRPVLRRVLLGLGGGTKYRQLREVIDQLSRQQVLVKVAGGFCLKKAMRKVLRRIYPQVSFVGQTDSLARPMFEADVALITPGVAAFEAAACGTPALYVCRDELQELTAASFAQYNAGRSLGRLAEFSAVGLADAFADLDLDARTTMGRAAKQLVDGLGAQRLIDFFRKQAII